jgi:hypothetical protein
MAASDSTTTVQKGIAFRVLGVLKNNNGQPVAPAGALSAKISQDCAAAVSTTNTPVAVGASMPGAIYLDLTASETNASCLFVSITDGTYSFVLNYATERYIVPATGGRPYDPYSMLYWIWAQSFNYSTLSGVQATVYDGTTGSDTVLATGTFSNTDTQCNNGAMRAP